MPNTKKFEVDTHHFPYAVEEVDQFNEFIILYIFNIHKKIGLFHEIKEGEVLNTNDVKAVYTSPKHKEVIIRHYALEHSFYKTLVRKKELINQTSWDILMSKRMKAFHIPTITAVSGLALSFGTLLTGPGAIIAGGAFGTIALTAGSYLSMKLIYIHTKKNQAKLMREHLHLDVHLPSMVEHTPELILSLISLYMVKFSGKKESVDLSKTERQAKDLCTSLLKHLRKVVGKGLSSQLEQYILPDSIRSSQTYAIQDRRRILQDWLKAFEGSLPDKTLDEDFLELLFEILEETERDWLMLQQEKAYLPKTLDLKKLYQNNLDDIEEEDEEDEKKYAQEPLFFPQVSKNNASFYYAPKTNMSPEEVITYIDDLEDHGTQVQISRF